MRNHQETTDVPSLTPARGYICGIPSRREIASPQRLLYQRVVKSHPLCTCHTPHVYEVEAQSDASYQYIPDPYSNGGYRTADRLRPGIWICNLYKSLPKVLHLLLYQPYTCVYGV